MQLRAVEASSTVPAPSTNRSPNRSAAVSSVFSAPETVIVTSRTEMPVFWMASIA